MSSAETFTQPGKFEKKKKKKKKIPLVTFSMLLKNWIDKWALFTLLPLSLKTGISFKNFKIIFIILLYEK